MAGTPQLPLQQGGTWKNEEKKKEKKKQLGPKIFWFDKGGAEELFHV